MGAHTHCHEVARRQNLTSISRSTRLCENQKNQGRIESSILGGTIFLLLTAVAVDVNQSLTCHATVYPQFGASAEFVQLPGLQIGQMGSAHERPAALNNLLEHERKGGCEDELHSRKGA